MPNRRHPSEQFVQHRVHRRHNGQHGVANKSSGVPAVGVLGSASPGRWKWGAVCFDSPRLGQLGRELTI